MAQPERHCPFNVDKGAELNLNECLTFAGNQQTLTIRGMFCDTIGSLYPIPPARIQLLHKRLSQCLYHTKESSVDVLLRTFLFDYTARKLVYSKRLSVAAKNRDTTVHLSIIGTVVFPSIESLWQTRVNRWTTTVRQ
jgi:hypothetical protein